MPKKDPYLGKRVQDYKILDIIGKGGMGTVYLAHHTVLEQYRAIKVIRGRLVEDEDFVERFIREAKILMRLRHPNLVQLHEFIALEEDTFFMVLELIRGESVLQRIKRMGRIPLLQSIQIIREAACGLHSAHQKGIIHRDISPDNLMIVSHENDNEVTKVLDFGIAKPLFDTNYQGLTGTKFFIGKPEYCSPEQCGILEENEVIDQRSDLYSLAVTFYHMLAGKLPFQSGTFQGYLLKHLNEIPKPVSCFLPTGEIPPALDALLMKALSKERDDRQCSLEEFNRDLEVAITSESFASKTKDVAGLSCGQTYPVDGSQQFRFDTTKPKTFKPKKSKGKTAFNLKDQIFILRNQGISTLAKVIVSLVLVLFSFGYIGTKTFLVSPDITVMINAVPWARVQINSESNKIKLPQEVLVTPFHIKLPAGKYSLSLENDYSDKPHLQIIEVSQTSNDFLIQMPKFDVDSAVKEIKEASEK